MNVVEALNYVASPATHADTTSNEALRALSAEVNRLTSHVLICSQALTDEALKRYPKDTRKGEWPEEGVHIHCWVECVWVPRQYISGRSLPGHLWLPAPPPPTDD